MSPVAHGGAAGSIVAVRGGRLSSPGMIDQIGNEDRVSLSGRSQLPAIKYSSCRLGLRRRHRNPQPALPHQGGGLPFAARRIPLTAMTRKLVTAIERHYTS